ncbi:MAG: hypothetical protein GC134_02460 [Proteobacteria bacterium]|nr:hypothetical protein [Pseudomonadota bacterium]
MHPFVYLMIATFIAAVAVLLVGVTGMGQTSTEGRKRSTKLMALRVALCFTLLCEMLFYANFIR